jgi:hypothetical protein
MRKPSPVSVALRTSLALGTLAFTAWTAQAQQLASTSLPDAPGLTVSSSHPDPTDSLQDHGQPVLPPAQPAHQDPQTKRILGIIPNFRAVSKDVKLPQQTVKDKFVTASQDSFDYSSIFLPLAVAAESQLANDTPEFGTGPAAYGRYLWHAAVDQTSENYFVEFIVPVLHHEDTRYYTLGRGGFVKRAGYSLGHTFVTKSDSGKSIFNAGEVIGAGAAAGISNLYYPAPERTLGNTLDKWGTNVGIDAFTFLFKEFWPDINHKLFHGSAPEQQ